MRLLERQTDLSFEELCDLIDAETGPGRPRCLCLNELGVIMRRGGEQGRRAESVLRALLDKRSREDRFIAYAYLRELTAPTVATIDALAAFEANAENAELIAIYRSPNGR